LFRILAKKKIELIKEHSIYITLRKVKAFFKTQVISKPNELYVDIHVCEVDESMCKNDLDDVGASFACSMTPFSPS